MNPLGETIVGKWMFNAMKNKKNPQFVDELKTFDEINEDDIYCDEDIPNSAYPFQCVGYFGFWFWGICRIVQKPSQRIQPICLCWAIDKDNYITCIQQLLRSNYKLETYSIKHEAKAIRNLTFGEDIDYFYFFAGNHSIRFDNKNRIWCYLACNLTYTFFKVS